MNEMVVFINLFFVPMLPLYVFYKRAVKALKLSLEIFMEYCIVAVFLIPVTKIILFMPSKLFHTQIYIYSGYYTIAALFAALVILLINDLRKNLLLKNCLKKLCQRKRRPKYLLCHQTDLSWSGKKKAAYHVYRILLIIFASFLFGLLLLNLATGDTKEIFLDYFQSWEIIALNTIPIVLLTLFLYGLTGRAWSGLLLGGGLATILALANYYKLCFRNDPLLVEDLFLFREATNMVSGGYSLFINEKIEWTIAGLFALTVFLYFAAPGKLLHWRKRGVVIIAAASISVMLLPVYSSQLVYEATQNEQTLLYNPVENYIWHGGWRSIPRCGS